MVEDRPVLKMSITVTDQYIKHNSINNETYGFNAAQGTYDCSDRLEVCFSVLRILLRGRNIENLSKFFHMNATIGPSPVKSIDDQSGIADLFCPFFKPCY